MARWCTHFPLARARRARLGYGQHERAAAEGIRDVSNAATGDRAGHWRARARGEQTRAGPLVKKGSVLRSTACGGLVPLAVNDHGSKQLTDAMIDTDCTTTHRKADIKATLSPRLRSSTFDDVWAFSTPSTGSASSTIHRRRSSLHRDWPATQSNALARDALRIQTRSSESQITTGSSSAVFSPVITSPTPISPTARASFDSFLRLDGSGTERRRSSLLSAPRTRKARGSDDEDNRDDVESPMASSSLSSSESIKQAGLRQTSYRATSSSAAAFVAAASAAPSFTLSHSHSYPQLVQSPSIANSLNGYPFPRNVASSSSLAPLPQDPYNILPLTSGPNTPLGSPPLSRFQTPSDSPRSEYPLPLTDASPRTSTSSSRAHIFATSNWSSTEGENDQSEEDDFTPLAAQREFIVNQSAWWPSAAPTSSSSTSTPRLSSEWARRKRKYRRWVAWVGRKTGLANIFPGYHYAAVRLSGGRSKARRRRELRQRERESLKDYGGEWVGQVLEWVPTRPWSIVRIRQFSAVVETDAAGSHPDAVCKLCSRFDIHFDSLAEPRQITPSMAVILPFTPSDALDFTRPNVNTA